jgi:hypothetical protein
VLEFVGLGFTTFDLLQTFNEPGLESLVGLKRLEMVIHGQRDAWSCRRQLVSWALAWELVCQDVK